MLKKASIALLASALVLPPTLSGAHPLPPPPVVHHPPPAGGGGGGIPVAGLAAGLVGFMGICLLPYVLSHERKKRDRAWARHVDVLPCGWDVVLAPQPGAITEASAVRRAPPRRPTCLPPRIMINGICTLNK